MLGIGNLRFVANVHRDSIRDAEYVARVRRHSPSSLIPLIAQAAAQYWEPDSWLKTPYKKFTPWALADIARVSLVSGNENRSAATGMTYFSAAPHTSRSMTPS